MIGAANLVTQAELRQATLASLVEAGKRFVVFMKGDEEAAAMMPDGIIPSAEAFTENWDDAMLSGDLEAAAAFLVKDLKTSAGHGSSSDRFYVMQANPNDNEKLMYARLNRKDAGEPNSLEEWLAPFLTGLDRLIHSAVEDEPSIHINAVSTDFLHVSKPIEIALRLNKARWATS
eukprot:gnl/TRDRNA2_/TRDRNA2_86506_c0_seq1.p1 gnl/TRDRNA2_/TRDRNA2_86506_c0~~gnl/TRDRNA2_/TRDRNA2_86506_c0_seq1.p1  ORF type:complete len:175 (+),score=45.65 gnl/TRDRNA2_/TRDRNA2_86506_c0_seq1:532-1056(+)